MTSENEITTSSHVIIGTAGHIDHGKTSLVKALTGVDTDRLKEEKERGLTIDFGFAHWGDRATIIDVPGHEKFIRNMVAGVSTIDFVLLIIAADDGVMPQTREHLDILQILQVKHGIIVLTKIDLVEEDWLTLVKDDIRNLVAATLLQKAPIVPVSSATMAGITELQETLKEHLPKVSRKIDRGVFWMPVDRSFSMKGFGTVVTGSVLSGAAQVGDSVEVLPDKKLVKIRGLQSHGSTVEKVTTGDRAAVNLQSVAKGELQRGHILATPSYFEPSTRIDARLHLLKSAPRTLKSGTRLRLHLGTAEIMTRVSLLGASQAEPGDVVYVQFHLERPISARRLDPFVVRQYSPTVTIGGGVILDANARRHKISDPAVVGHLQTIEKENPQEVLDRQLLKAQYRLITFDELASDLAISRKTLQDYIKELEAQNKATVLKKEGKPAVIHSDNLQRLQHLIVEKLKAFHQENPTKLGLPKAQFPKQLKASADPALLEYTLHALSEQGQVAEAGGFLHLDSHRPTLSPEQEIVRGKIEKNLYDEAFTTSSESELCQKLAVDASALKEILDHMISQNQLVRLDNNLLFHQRRISEAKEAVVNYLNSHEEISVGEFKELLGGTSRKFALPILLYFDGLGITERDGDVRILGADKSSQ